MEPPSMRLHSQLIGVGISWQGGKKQFNIGWQFCNYLKFQSAPKTRNYI